MARARAGPRTGARSRLGLGLGLAIGLGRGLELQGTPLLPSGGQGCVALGPAPIGDEVRAQCVGGVRGEVGQGKKHMASGSYPPSGCRNLWTICSSRPQSHLASPIWPVTLTAPPSTGDKLYVATLSTHLRFVMLIPNAEPNPSWILQIGHWTVYAW